jgi:uncharacterized protein YndB with AHSA1/START domain
VTESQPDIKTICFERNLAHPPSKVWRALTVPAFLEEWLMKANFRLQHGHRFNFQADWGHVDCEILEFETERRLSYTWGDGTLETVVTWTLTPAKNGTLLTMEQSGFKKDQPRYYGGALQGWPRFFDQLETALARGD